MIGPDGLPARVMNNGQVYEMQDYTAASVRVSTIFGGVQYESIVPFDSFLESMESPIPLGLKQASNKTLHSPTMWELGFAVARSSFPEFRDKVLRPTLGIMGHVLGISACLATTFPEPATTTLTAAACGSYLAQQASGLLFDEDNELAQSTSIATNIAQCALLRECVGSIVGAANGVLEVSALLDETPVDLPDGPQPTCENPNEEYSAAFGFCAPLYPAGFTVTSYLYDCRNEHNCEPTLPFPHPSGQGALPLNLTAPTASSSITIGMGNAKHGARALIQIARTALPIRQSTTCVLAFATQASCSTARVRNASRTSIARRAHHLMHRGAASVTTAMYRAPPTQAASSMPTARPDQCLQVPMNVPARPDT